MDYKPSILDYKVRHTPDNVIKYVVTPSGGCYATHSEQWMEDRPTDWDAHAERPVLPEDLLHLVVHGLVPFNDYEALKDKGMVDATTQKVWHNMQKLRDFLAEKQKPEIPEMEYGDLDWSGVDLDSEEANDGR